MKAILLLTRIAAVLHLKINMGLKLTSSGIPGATYTASIPGKNILATAHNNQRHL
jgi:hypothetical protein